MRHRWRAIARRFSPENCSTAPTTSSGWPNWRKPCRFPCGRCTGPRCAHPWTRRTGSSTASSGAPGGATRRHAGPRHGWTRREAGVRGERDSPSRADGRCGARELNDPRQPSRGAAPARAVSSPFAAPAASMARGVQARRPGAPVLAFSRSRTGPRGPRECRRYERTVLRGAVLHKSFTVNMQDRVPLPSFRKRTLCARVELMCGSLLR